MFNIAEFDLSVIIDYCPTARLSVDGKAWSVKCRRPTKNYGF